MATLLDTLNVVRENKISTHYGAASAELKDKIERDPLKTVFHIYAGCVSKEVTNEIAFRFNSGGLKATPGISGVVSTRYFLTVEVDLPEILVHPEQGEETKVELASEVQETSDQSLNSKEIVA